MTIRRALSALMFLSLAGSATGCGKILGNLRPDLDDSEATSLPTIGGRWSERGFLADESDDADRYAAVGHSERSPASDRYDGGGGRRSWVGSENVDANRRDMYRGDGSDEEGTVDPSFSSNPSLPPPTKRLYKNGARATRSDFMDESTNEGSLWASDGQTNYYFTKNKIRGVGDILTISMEHDLIHDTSTEVSRTLTPREKEMELTLAQERIRARTLGLEDPDAKTGKDSVAASASGPNRNPAAAGAAAKNTGKPAYSVVEDDVTIPKATAADIDVAKTLGLKNGDTMMAEIVERYPNGNYKIRGTKKIPYRGGARLLTLVGVAKGSDITEDDQVNSGKLYEYRLEVIR